MTMAPAPQVADGDNDMAAPTPRARGAIGARGMRALQQRLGRATTVEELFARASMEAAHLCGFERAVVLAVDHGTLVANATGAISDEACDALRRAVLSHPVPLVPDSDEAELVRLPGRLTNSRRAAPSTLKSSLGLDHHLVVPIAPEGRTIALLLLDRPEVSVSDPDRETAEIVAQLLELALERLVLRQRLRQLEENLRHITTSAQALVREAVHAPVELPCEGGHGLIVSVFPMGEGHGRVPDASAAALTHREEQIAVLLVAGRSNREIAGELHLSPETVKGYVAKLLRKLNAANRVEAVAQLARSFQLAEQD